MAWFVAQLRCLECGQIQFLDKAGLANWLKDCGRLRRDSRPDVELMLELGKLDAASTSCSDCGSLGMALELPQEEEADWGDARRCEVCHQTIDPLRLEVFPDSTRCTACQKQSEEGNDVTPDEVEYCPHCGSPMQLKTQQSGVTRYQLVCTACRRRQS